MSTPMNTETPPRHPAVDVVLDFVIAGETEPYAIAGEGLAAAVIALRIAETTDTLEAAVRGLIELAYVLEGNAASPEAAATLRTVVLSTPEAARVLEPKTAKQLGRPRRAVALAG